MAAGMALSVCADEALDSWLAEYDEHSLHAALGVKPPRQFERDHPPSPNTGFVAA
jgi:hypothetical protein